MRDAPYVRPVRVRVDRRADGTLIVTNPHPMHAAFANTLLPLRHWAGAAPGRLWLAGVEDGAWRQLSYGEGWRAVRALAAGLAARFAPGSTLAIASGNSLSHALMTYGAALAGLVAAPVTPAYSVKARDPRRLQEALALVKARAVLMEGEAFARAAGWARAAGVTVIAAGSLAPEPGDLALDTLAGDPDAAPDPDALDPAAACKYLLTSGSTGTPKAVIVTHANLAANAAQIRATFDPVREAQLWPDGIVMACHLPWSHSLGGNAVLHMLAHAGGSLWIDPGAPTPEGLTATLDTIARVRPNYHLTVPLGWALLVGALERDGDLAQAFFERLRVMQYGGAALTQDVHARLDAIARRVTGGPVTLAAGYGATETAPTVCNVHWPNDRMGLVGLPVPGLELKLVPAGGKLEARVRGPGITPGYLGDPARTAEAFDEEGFYRLGDALRFVDPDRPEAGLAFDGRLSETFKLANGSWVPVGPVRLRLVEASKGLFSDAVIAGEGDDAVVALAFLDAAAAAALTAPGALEQAARQALDAAAAGQPATRRVARLVLLSGPPSLEEGEITDKGYLNQARCRDVRAADVARARAGGPGVLEAAP